MTFGENGYYSLRSILGYNCKYNIVLSERGIGKSYGTKIFLMRQPGTIMCLYRQAPDMQLAIQDWIDPLLENGWNIEQFEWEGSKQDGWVLKVNGAKKVWFRYLTQVNHIKQEKFPDNMDWVWFDEFIPLVYKKLSGVESEGDALRTIIKTIEHDTIRSREEKGLRPLRVLMFANPFTWNNPLLGYFKVKPRYGIHRIGPGIVCELVEPLEKPQQKKQSADDFLGMDVSKNQGWLDQQAFIVDPFPKDCVPISSIRINDMFFTIYQKGTKYYVKQTNKHLNTVKMYGTLSGLKETEECLEYWNYLDTFRTMCYKGKVWFNNINTKFNFLNNI